MAQTHETVSSVRIAKACAWVVGIGWAVIGFSAALSPSEEERVAADLKRKTASAMTSMVADCAAREGPWRCFVKLEALDASNPLDGRTRLQHFARMVPAWEVLAFCTEPRFVDCADRMVGKAYSREEILAAIGE